MRRKGLLSWEFNMSLGFVPVLISILLCEWVGRAIAIAVGIALGLLLSYYYLRHSKRSLPNIILYLSTAILMLIGVADLIFSEGIPSVAYPMTVELSILIPILVLFLHKRRFINAYLNRSKGVDKTRLTQGIESSFVAVNILLLFGLFHFVVIGLALLFFSPLGTNWHLVLYQVFPPVIFVLTIIVNQFSLQYFNKIAKQTEYFPIVNSKGGVIGKTLASEVLEGMHKEDLYPVIRIAVLHEGMLFLCERSQNFLLDKGKMDIPCESYLKFGETLEEGCKRLLEKYFPDATGLTPTFSITYRFQNEITSRLIYLFLLDVEDDSLLTNQRFVGGKLWQLQQIEQNIGQDFFSECFENEFDYLKDIIDIREIYKES